MSQNIQEESWIFTEWTTPLQGCRLPQTHMPVVCWNDIRRIQLTCSWAWLACSYFTKAQPRGLDFTHQNRTQVNAYRLLLSFSFFCFHVRVKVNSLAFAIGNVHPYSSEFVSQHVAAAFRLKQQSASSKKKSNAEKKGKRIRNMKKKANRKWQDCWKWAASGEERTWLTNDEAKSGIGDHRT